jgi:predicted RNA-binding protein associated with RNAse of E/G family
MIDGGVQWWYVNFQRPLRRTTLGFDTMDEMLDLVVSPDCREWQRKDADEMELAVDMGFLSRSDAQRIERNCHAVEKSLARGDVPWNRTWATWRPDS